MMHWTAPMRTDMPSQRLAAIFPCQMETLTDMELETKFECLFYTNDLLDRLVDYHNRLLSGGIGRIFKRINYRELRDAIRGTLQALQETESVYHQVEGSFPELYWPLVDVTYVEYCASVHVAYAKLASICDGLHQKANGREYPRNTYNSDVEDYERLVCIYQEVRYSLTRFVNAYGVCRDN